MFREPHTERPPAKMKDVGQSDENASTRIAESFYLIYGVIKNKQEGNSKLPQNKPQSCRATIIEAAMIKKGSKDK